MGVFVGAILLVTLAACAGETTAGAPASPSTAPVVSQAPAKPPPPPTPSPAVLIPNVTQDVALTLYLDQGFTCIVVPATHPSWIRNRCTKASSSALAAADFEGPGTGIVNLKASTLGMPSTIVESFLGDSADLPFDGANSATVVQWVTDSLPKGGATLVIGGVHLVLLNSPPVSWVTLKAS